MVMRGYNRPFMGRPEYDALAARTEADFSFVDQVDQLFTEGGEASIGEVQYQASRDGLSGEASIVLEEYNRAADANDETRIDVMYWTDNGPADSNYNIRIASLPQRDTLTAESNPLVTQYDIQQYRDQYFGYVYHSHVDEGHEMTPYDYRELRRVLEFARIVQLAERRERAIMGE